MEQDIVQIFTTLLHKLQQQTRQLISYAVLNTT